MFVNWNVYGVGFVYILDMMFLDFDFYRLVNVDRYQFFNFNRDSFFDFFSYQFVNGHMDWMRYRYVYCIRLWYWNFNDLRCGYSDGMRNWYSDFFNNFYRFCLCMFDCMRWNIIMLDLYFWLKVYVFFVVSAVMRSYVDAVGNEVS